MKENIKYQITSVFNITYRCDQDCEFCFNKHRINRIPDMSFDQIKNNYYYVKKKYNIDNIVLSGGEPTLHPKIYEILDFIYNYARDQVNCSLNTNGVVFSRKKHVQKMNIILKRNKLFKGIVLSLSNIYNKEDLFSKSNSKMLGVLNLIKLSLKKNVRLQIIITCTKKNMIIIPDIIKYLNYYIKPIINNNQVTLQLRLPYIGKDYIDEKQLNEILPSRIEIFLPHIIRSINTLNNSIFNIRLYNIPFCLFNSNVDINNILSRYRDIPIEKRMMVNYYIQKEKIKPKIFQQDEFLYAECVDCIYNKNCNKIQKKYIEDEFIKGLNTINNSGR